VPVLQLGVDRATATLERLAALHAACEQPAGLDVPLPDGVSLVVLTTCHRLEWYLEGVDRRQAHALFADWLNRHPALEPITCREGEEAARHLLRVVAGLESAVLGEDQILCQARAAYRRACAAQRSGRLLHRVFHAAFRVGRRVRAETDLGAGTRSLAGAAVAAIHRRFGRLRERSVLVLGAGEMAGLAVRLLAGRQVGRLFVANRSPERAAQLAARFGGQPARWEWRTGLLKSVDAVICATSASTPVLDAASLRRVAALRSTPLAVVDLGVPPNAEAPGVAGIEVIDVERLGALLAEEGDRRATAVRQAAAIVEEELRAWVSWIAAAEPPAPRRCSAGELTIKDTCFRSG
jgi:glutamyl-tRNA reductase